MHGFYSTYQNSTVLRSIREIIKCCCHFMTIVSLLDPRTHFIWLVEQ